MADYRLTDDKPFNSESSTALVTTAETPASIEVPKSGIYSIGVVGMDETHLLLFRMGSDSTEAETIAAVDGTFQAGVSARTHLDVRPVYIEGGQFFGVLEQGATTGLLVVLTLIHQFRAEGLVG